VHGTTATRGRRVRPGRSAVYALADAGTLGVGLFALAAGVSYALLVALGTSPAAPERAAEIAAAAAWALWGGRPPARSAPLPNGSEPRLPRTAAGRLRWAVALRLAGGSLLAFACTLCLSHGFAGGPGGLPLLDVAALVLGTAFGCAVAVEAAREAPAARLATGESALAQGEQSLAPALEREALEHPVARPLAG